MSYSGVPQALEAAPDWARVQLGGAPGSRNTSFRRQFPCTPICVLLLALKQENSLGSRDHGGSEVCVVTGEEGRPEGPPQCSGLQGPSNVGRSQLVRDSVRT